MRYVLYRPGGRPANFSFADKMDSALEASSHVFKDNLKSLVSPVVDRVYRFIVGKDRVAHENKDRAYKDVAKYQIEGRESDIRKTLSDANNYLKSNKIKLDEDLSDEGGFDYAIKKAKGSKNKDAVKKLEEYRRKIQGYNQDISNIDAMNRHYQAKESYKPKGWFQKLRNKIGDTFLNTLGMGRDFDPREAGTWGDYFGSSMVEKNMSDWMRGLQDRAYGIADMAYQYSPNLGKSIFRGIQAIKQPFVDAANEEARKNSALARFYTNMSGKLPGRKVLSYSGEVNPYGDAKRVLSGAANPLSAEWTKDQAQRMGMSDDTVQKFYDTAKQARAADTANSSASGSQKKFSRIRRLTPYEIYQHSYYRPR